MGFKSRNQVMMEQVYESRGRMQEMTDVAYSILEDYEVDIARDIFMEMFEQDLQTALDVWEEVMDNIEGMT
jgi:hypothetical protein